MLISKPLLVYSNVGLLSIFKLGTLALMLPRLENVLDLGCLSEAPVKLCFFKLLMSSLRSVVSFLVFIKTDFDLTSKAFSTFCFTVSLSLAGSVLLN